MPNLKIIYQATQTQGNTTVTVSGAAVSLDGAMTFSAQCIVDVTGATSATVKLQKSNDGTNWSDEGSATAVTVDAVVYLEKIDPTALYMRVTYTMTSGTLASSTLILTKGLN